jgi:hypothetical protein
MKNSLLAVALTILGCSAQPGGWRVDPALAALIPGDTILLSGVRMSELRSTALYVKLMSQQRLSDLDDFARRTNFDPRKDVNDMLIASDGADGIVLARGNFKPQPLPGLKKTIYKGAAVYSTDGGAYAILDPTTAVAGPERGVRKVIDQKQSGRGGAAALLDRARALPAAGQIWFVSNGWGNLPERMAGQGGNLSNFGRFFQSLENATATVDLRSGITAAANGQARTDQDAKTLGDAARGMIGLGRLSVPENQPEMLRLFDGIKVEQQQRSIQLNVRIPPELIDRLLQATDTRPKAPAHSR